MAGVRDDPAGRLRLAQALYESRPRGSGYLPYRRAMTAFMRWQLRRGLLEPAGAPRPGSQWWRALNEAVLRDIAEARHLVAGAPGDASSPAVEVILDFIRRPSAARWYRAHNVCIARAYLANRDLGLAQLPRRPVVQRPQPRLDDPVSSSRPNPFSSATKGPTSSPRG